MALHRPHLIYRAPAELVSDLWPAIELHVERAMEHHPFMEADDVLLLLQQGTLQLFVSTDDRKVAGFAVMEVIQYPRRKVANVLACGGEHGFLSVAVHELLPVLKAWAAERGADTFALSGRPGWVRALKSKGFSSVAHITMWADLNVEGRRRRRESNSPDSYTNSLAASPAVHH
jgi:hypothetical protein